MGRTGTRRPCRAEELVSSTENPFPPSPLAVRVPAGWREGVRTARGCLPQVRCDRCNSKGPSSLCAPALLPDAPRKLPGWFTCEMDTGVNRDPLRFSDETAPGFSLYCFVFCLR